LIYFGGKCAYCGSTPRKNKRLTKDHLEPISQGGGTIPENIVPACFSCNSSKGAEDFKDWFMKQSFFSQDSLNTIFKWRSIMRQAGDD
jgi:5-methylcytosine-specific restriction endonuclease McrA